MAVWTFLLGNGISLIGNAFALVAVPWFVLETTGSASRTGLVGMMTVLPALASGILGGVLVDRLGGRRMSVVADVISGLAVLAIPLLHRAGALEFWSLLLLVLIGAALDIPGVTGRRLLLPELARNAGLRDEAVASWNETMQGAAVIIGPLTAGLLIAWIDTVSLLWITAAGFFVSALAIGLWSPPGKHEAEPGDAHAVRGAIAELQAGFQALRGDSLLLALAFGLTLMNVLHTPFWSVVLPVLVDDRWGVAARLGLLLTVLGIGNIVGGLTFGAVGHRVRAHRRLVFLGAVASFPAMLWVYVATTSFPVLVLTGFAAGALAGPINPLLVTVRLERIPPALRGRVFATFSGLAGAAAPLGMVLFGWLLDAAGVQAGLVILACVATLFAAGLWLVPSLREMNVPATESRAPVTIPRAAKAREVVR